MLMIAEKGWQIGFWVCSNCVVNVVNVHCHIL